MSKYVEINLRELEIINDRLNIFDQEKKTWLKSQ